MILYMFRALYAHHQEVEFINAASGIVIFSKWHPVHRLRENCSSLSTWAPESCLLRVTISDAASVQFSLLMMSIQGVTGGTDQTSGECSLGQTISI